ncbi:MAG: AAA family ATPase, partial [Candidatus Nanoarchaeia archaeon]
MSISDTLSKLDYGKYTNNREIALGNVPFTAREVLIKAPLIAGINVYLIGGTGEGKTELANDLMGYMGSAGCYTIGRPDFEPAELLKQVRLDKLKEVSSDRELVELTENVDKNLFYVDELNRCPPIVQNYFFDFFDGKLVHQGKIRRLGKDGYTLGYATGNLGNGEYVGVSDSDRALLDRMHMIVKLDHPDFATTALDDFEIFAGKKDPRASMPEGTDISQELIAMHKAFGERQTGLLLPLLGVYLTKGLDYLEDTTDNSKRALGPRWTEAKGVRTDNDENKIYPLSKRAVFGAISLTCALEMIAQEKGYDPNTTALFLDSLRLTVPYSGVITPAYLDMDHRGA